MQTRLVLFFSPEVKHFIYCHLLSFSFFVSFFCLEILKLTSTAGVHQMRPFCRHSLIIIIIIVVVVVTVVGRLKCFQSQKPRFSSFENNTRLIYRRMDGRTDQRTDGHDLLQRCVVASKKNTSIDGVEVDKCKDDVHFFSPSRNGKLKQNFFPLLLLVSYFSLFF